MIRVLVADDQALIHAGLRALLDGEDDIEVVGEACDSEEAVSVASRTPTDVVLTPIRSSCCAESASWPEEARCSLRASPGD